MDCLVLNGDSTPLSVLPISSISWQEAIKLTYLDKCYPLHYHDDWVLHSPSCEMKVPAVIVLKEFFHIKKNDVKLNRNNIIYRDMLTCQYCGVIFNHFQLTLDHVIPKTLGGKKSWDNIVSSCKSCNSKKGHHSFMSPLKFPKKPSYWNLVNNRKKFPISVKHHSWNFYLQWPENLIIGFLPEDQNYILPTNIIDF